VNLPDYMPILSSGAHDSPTEGACVMEYVSVLAGEPWTDRPKCTHQALATLAINVNDRLGDGDRQVLVPLIPRLIGTATDDPRVNVALAVYLLRKTWGVVWPRWAAELLPAWGVLDRWARDDKTVTIDDLCAAAATTAAAYGYRLDLLDILTGALDVFDEVSGRRRSELVEQQWRDLAAVVTA
jgi:hypothetical protein